VQQTSETQQMQPGTQDGPVCAAYEYACYVYACCHMLCGQLACIYAGAGDCHLQYLSIASEQLVHWGTISRQQLQPVCTGSSS
jgi:hypothetical protein